MTEESDRWSRPSRPEEQRGAAVSKSSMGLAASSEAASHRHPAHHPLITRHNTPSVVFLTVCVKNRNQILACDLAVNAMIQAWREATHWKTGWFLAMPDHVHFFG